MNTENATLNTFRCSVALAFVALAAAAPVCLAQTALAGPLTLEQTQAQVAGKKFSVPTPDGNTAQVEYGTNGSYYVQVQGRSASGKWSTEPGRVCTDMFGKKECRDLRMQGEELQLQRSDATWVRMTAR